METEKIASYLATHDYILLNVKPEELEKDGGLRYFQLLEAVGAKREYLLKFCSRVEINFPGYEAELWTAPLPRLFVEKLSEKLPYLFFLAEKKGDTLKNLLILACATGEKSQDDMALDQKKYQDFLHKQLVNVLHISAQIGLPPEQAEDTINEINAYYGL